VNHQPMSWISHELLWLAFSEKKIKYPLTWGTNKSQLIKPNFL